MSRQVKVLAFSMRALTCVLRGEARVVNVPADAEVVAACPDLEGKRVGLMVFSASYPRVPCGQRLPVLTAVVAPVAVPATSQRVAA